MEEINNNHNHNNEIVNDINNIQSNLQEKIDLLINNYNDIIIENNALKKELYELKNKYKDVINENKSLQQEIINLNKQNELNINQSSPSPSPSPNAVDYDKVAVNDIVINNNNKENNLIVEVGDNSSSITNNKVGNIVTTPTPLSSLLYSKKNKIPTNNKLLMETQQSQNKKHQLFDQFLIIDANKELEYANNGSWYVEGEVVYKYPNEVIIDEKMCCQVVSPDKLKIQPLEFTESSTHLHSLLLDNDRFKYGEHCYVTTIKNNNSRQFGDKDFTYLCCVRSREVGFMKTNMGIIVQVIKPVIYCICSNRPLFLYYFSIILSLLALKHVKTLENTDLEAIILSDISECLQILKELYSSNIINKTEQYIELTNGILPLHCKNLNINLYTAIEEVHCPIAFAYCSLPWTIQSKSGKIRRVKDCMFDVLIRCILLEYNIVIIEEQINIRTSACWSLLSILQPLIWVGQFIPTVPYDIIDDIIDAPVPLIIGCNKFPNIDLKKYPRLCVWFPSQNQIIVPTEMDHVLISNSNIRKFVDLALLKELTSIITTSTGSLLSIKYNNLENSKLVTSAILQTIHNIVNEIINQYDPHNSFDILFRQTQMFDYYQQKQSRNIRDIIANTRRAYNIKSSNIFQK